jgi:hypothetical protein
VAIKVKVERGQRATPLPKPAVETRPSPLQPSRTDSLAPRQSLPRTAKAFIGRPVLPHADRRRLMWSIVGVGMVIIIVGWALTFSSNLRGASGGNPLFNDIAKIFRSATPTSERSTAQSKEIRQLEEQVFPQFQ